MLKVFIIPILFFSLMFSYEIGDTITSGHQNTEYGICYGSSLDPNNDGIFTFSEYNGDLNGGDYHIIFIDMSASW